MNVFNRAKPYLLGCLWLGLAVFTRQSYIFLGLPFAVCLFLRGNPGVTTCFIAFAALALALLPTVGIFIVWGGLVPPYWRSRVVPGGVPFFLHSIAMPLAILGFYTIFFRGPEIWTWIVDSGKIGFRRQAGTIVTVVCLGFVCSLFLTGGNDEYSGFLNNVASQFPRIFGIDLVTWLLVQVGLWAMFSEIQSFSGQDPGETIGFLSLIGICIVSSTNHVASQKYYDAQVLACLLWQIQPGKAENRRWKVSMWVLIGLFCLYHFTRQFPNW